MQSTSAAFLPFPSPSRRAKIVVLVVDILARGDISGLTFETSFISSATLFTEALTLGGNGAKSLSRLHCPMHVRSAIKINGIWPISASFSIRPRSSSLFLEGICTWVLPIFLSEANCRNSWQNSISPGYFPYMDKRGDRLWKTRTCSITGLLTMLKKMELKTLLAHF